MLNSHLVLIIVTFSYFIKFTFSCNEYVCASIVSKCTLLQSCKCDVETCSCCKTCYDCLKVHNTSLYSECCSCFDLCPKPNNTQRVDSQTGDLEYPVTGMFKVLTESPDLLVDTKIFAFPIDIDALIYKSKMDEDFNKNILSSGEQSNLASFNRNIVTVNCTVVYVDQCMPRSKCIDHCSSLGASFWRWFHDGCCECAGQTCLKYGINESRCYDCPERDIDDDDDNEEFDDDDMFTYGENFDA